MVKFSQVCVCMLSSHLSFSHCHFALFLQDDLFMCVFQVVLLFVLCLFPLYPSDSNVQVDLAMQSRLQVC